MEITKEILSSILDAYAYEIVFADRNHIVQYMNKTAQLRYQGRVKIGESLFNCHTTTKTVFAQFAISHIQQIPVFTSCTGTRNCSLPLLQKAALLWKQWETDK